MVIVFTTLHRYSLIGIKKGADNEQFFKAYQWDGKKLKQDFAIDFTKEKLGRAHQMRFGAYSLYPNKVVDVTASTAPKS